MKKPFAIQRNSTKNDTRPSNLLDTNPAMKSKNLSNYTVKSAACRAGIAAAVTAVAIQLAHADPIVIVAGTANIAPTGAFDLTNEGLVLRDGATAGRYAVYNGYITTGLYNGPGGYWDGPGINSTTAAAGSITAIGILNNADAGYTNFLGVAVVSSDILIRYTYFGDIDLNGVVDAVDYSLINSGFGTSGGGWLSGDLDYNGTVDAVDYSLINPSFGAPALPGVVGFSAGGGKASVVPEPSSLGLLMIGALGLLGRQRKTTRQ